MSNCPNLLLDKLIEPTIEIKKEDETTLPLDLKQDSKNVTPFKSKVHYVLFSCA